MASYNKRISDQSKVKFNPINRELEDSENSELDSRVDNLEENILGSKTATGNPITVTDAAPVNAVNLSMNLEPIQAGSGTPSTDNIRPISGRSEVAINRVSGEVTDTYTIQLGDTVYGGTLDVTRGELRVTHGYVEYSSVTGTGVGSTFTFDIPQNMNVDVSDTEVAHLTSDKLKAYSVQSVVFGDIIGIAVSRTSGVIYTRFPSSYGTTTSDIDAKLAVDPLQVVYELAAPITIPLTPTQIKLLENTNTIYTDYEGDTITIEYRLNTPIGEVLGEIDNIYNKIDDIYNKIGSLDTRVTALEES